MHNFDELINRRGTDSVKWNGQMPKYSSNDLLPMWVADTDFLTYQPIIDALVQRAEHGIFGYTNSEDDCKNAISLWHKKRNTITYDVETITLSPSVLTSLQLAIQTVTTDTERVMITLPTYGPFHHIITATNRNLVTSTLLHDKGTYSMNFEEIEARFIEEQVKVFILCNPHNPTGHVWTEEELVQLISLCKKYDVFIIADEIHSDLIMPGYTFTPIMSVARLLNYTPKVIMINAPTKTFNLASIQTSYFIVESKQLLEQIMTRAAYLGVMLGVNVFGLVAMKTAYTSGDSYVDELVKYIQTNYNFLKTEVLTKYPNVSIADLEATYLVWLDVTSLCADEETVQKAMQDAGVSVQTKTDFFEEDTVHIRINIAMPFTRLQDGVSRICKGLESLV